ncbi:MAG: energy transducer TonB, partial [Balneolaceae bacterium]
IETSGDVDGTTGEVNVDQGTGNTSDKSAPYALEWEGELDRSPMIQPLPSNETNEEAVITIRFEVNPDGSLGRVRPLRKMNPELEREVMRTLRSWRFSRLPAGVPQEPQWGTITFRFVLE